ncbi:MAG: hypothetical protein HQL52_06560 [Magnetococcales bacterium]|nr:hypothetical protein [Magnetococcales bacterium]
MSGISGAAFNESARLQLAYSNQRTENRDEGQDRKEGYSTLAKELKATNANTNVLADMARTDRVELSERVAEKGASRRAESARAPEQNTPRPQESERALEAMPEPPPERDQVRTIDIMA